MKLITFLGTGNYLPANYVWQDESIETCYVARAMCRFFQPSTVMAFATTESKEKHWDPFSGQITEELAIEQDNQSVTHSVIPLGQSEEEIWAIFDALVEAVEPNSDVIFDITHAFRSIPMMVLLGAAFLRKARNVNIAGVYYGAYVPQAGNAPIIDLTPAIELLDWLVATDKFVTTGSSVELAELLAEAQKAYFRENKNSTSVQPKNLQDISNKIQAISNSIDLVRPIDLLQEAAEIQAIETDSLLDEVGIFAKPFELLLEGIKKDYEQFALADWKQQPKGAIKKQFALLEWYVDKKQYVQALLLAREWVVSVVCLSQQQDYLDKDARRLITEQLGNTLRKTREYSPELKRVFSDPSNIAGIWRKITTFRNDLAHAQTRMSGKNAEEMQVYIEKTLLNQLKSNFHAWIV